MSRKPKEKSPSAAATADTGVFQKEHRKNTPRRDRSQAKNRKRRSKTSPTRQTSPKGGGEPKSPNDKEIRPSRQLATKVPSSEQNGDTAAAEKMLASPNLAAQIVEDVQVLGIVGEDDLILMIYVTATGRVLPKAIHLCVHGGYSSGKSRIVSMVLKLIPEEDVTSGTQVTAKYLFNLSEEQAAMHRNKIIFESELTSGKGSLGFRDMAEAGRVQNLTVRDGVSQNSVAEGPITFIATTTLSPREMKDEDASRWFYWATDDSTSQTQRVMDARAKQAIEPGSQKVKHGIVAKHHAAQAMLGKRANVEVCIPFADLIKLPADDPGSRRLQDRILLLVTAVAFLCQFRAGRQPPPRTNGDRDVVTADAEDWRIALPLVRKLLAQKLEVPQQAARKFLEDVNELGTGPFTMADLERELNMPEATVRRRIGNLPQSCVDKKWDGKKFLYRFRAAQALDEIVELPTPDQVGEYLRTRGKLASKT